MDYQWKIISHSPGRESHLVDLEVEILKAGGARFNPPKVLTVEVTDNADEDDIRGAVREAFRGQIRIADMVGQTFNLRRGR